MLIKSADDKQPDIDVLTALLERSDLYASTRQKIEQEIRTIRAGVAGEREAAHEIDFHYGDSKKLRGHPRPPDRSRRPGRPDRPSAASIGCSTSGSSRASTSPRESGSTNKANGSPSGTGRPHGIASPVEQNRQHVAVLREAFDQGLVRLPRRLGVKLKPQLHSLILVSSGARISRPRGPTAAARVDGLDTVIKVDQLATTIGKQVDETGALSTLGSLARLVSMETLEDIGRQLVALHRPSQVDWAARFGLSSAPAVPPVAVSLAATAASPATSRPCSSCGSSVSPKVAAYCEANTQRFGGLIICWDCQRRSRRDAGV